MKGTLALSWGSWGGFYVRLRFCPRLCIGPVALTYCPVEIDALMEAYASAAESDVPVDRTDRLPPTNVSRKESHEG